SCRTECVCSVSSRVRPSSTPTCLSSPALSVTAGVRFQTRTEFSLYSSVSSWVYQKAGLSRPAQEWGRSTFLMIDKVTLAAVLLFAGFSVAQTPLGFDDVVRLALSQRPELQASAARVESAEQLRRQSALFPNPRLVLQSENIRSSGLNYGQDADTFAYASQVVETSGSRKNRFAVAQGAVSRSELEVQLGRRDIAEGVRDAYWNALA